MPTIELLDYSQVRPELVSLEVLWTQPMQVQEEAISRLRGTHNASAVCCRWQKRRADELFAAKKYEEAIETYKTAMREILGQDFELPVKGYINETYLQFTVKGAWACHLDLVECCEALARCYLEIGNILEATDWLQESEVLYINQRLGSQPNDLPFMNVHIPILNHFTVRFRMSACNLYSKILRDLGNTATAAFFAHRSMSNGASVLPKDNVHIQKLRNESDAVHLLQLRHPEPTYVDKFIITQPTMQVRGAWTKLQTTGACPPSRMAFSSFIWKSKLYITAGRHARANPFQFHVDLWCLDLSIKIWRRLPDPIGGRNLNKQAKVWNDKAWMFVGTRELLCFDLVAEKWSKVRTKLSHGKWPYYQGLDEYCMEIFDDIMYVFGGDDSLSDLGTNIFMALDMKTLVWMHLGGTSVAKATREMPMLRRFPSSWVVPSQQRLYIMYGNICRSAALRHRKQYGHDEDYNHEDIWSYHVPSKTWRSERIRGNFPSPRTEMACAYNAKIDSVCVYGGYNASTSSIVGNYHWSFVYYGDTFIQDPSTGVWRHVLTRGFPSYRAESQLLVDEETGRMYLYGGYTNSSYVPSKHEITRSFGDVWQLSVDMPGGHYEEADLERDLKSPKMGPWTRCFTCGAIGNSWRKCGGSCGGKYVFCSTECLKEGWKEHKETHGCHKVK